MNLANKLDFQSLQSINSKIKKVFFYRVCGTGMGAAACLLKEKGFLVEGGDNNYYPPMSTYLETTGIPLHQLSDITPDFLKTFDLIVVGNVVPGSSEEARMIEGLGVPFCSFPTAIGALVLCHVNVIGIAGTHGKTTTTYLATQVFEKLQTNPGYLIGGVMEGRPSSRLGSGSYFFIESDEYDSAYFEKISKFRSYSINNLILTSLEFDHADIFKNIDDIKKQFQSAIPNIDKKFILCVDYPAACDLLEEFKDNDLPWYIYGDNSNVGPKIIEANSDSTVFQVLYQRQMLQFETNLVGKHNIFNLAAVILFALTENFSPEAIQNAITDLKLVKRRQEVRGNYKGSPVIDDFAHHPRAVELTLDAIITKYPNRKIHVVMEPNSATARSSIFQVEFERSLDRAASVVFTKPTRPTSVKDAKDLDINLITDNVKKSGRYASVVGNLDELMTEIEKLVANDSVILILSNGTCLGFWQSDLVKNFK